MAHDHPMYVDRLKTGASWQPFIVDHARIYCFGFPAAKRNLQDLCDRYLNVPNGTRNQYRPYVPCVFVTVSRIPSLRSSNRPYSAWGSDSESELALWVAVRD